MAGLCRFLEERFEMGIAVGPFHVFIGFRKKYFQAGMAVGPAHDYVANQSEQMRIVRDRLI